MGTYKDEYHSRCFSMRWSCIFKYLTWAIQHENIKINADFKISMVEYKVEQYEMLITSLRRNSKNKLGKCQSQEPIKFSKQKGQSEK